MILIKITAAAILAVNAALVLPALATDDANQDTLIIEHKLSLIDEQIDDDNYEQSEQAANARYANSFLAKAYKDNEK